jgi:cellulose synthase/poly-beta-1,6-N-acetylglucosamine synthase-like glycosyltransferase
MTGWLITALVVFEQLVLLYFLAINTSYLAFSLLAFFQLRQRGRRWTTHELESVLQSPATPGVTVIAPAYNEQETIVQSMRALLLLNYPQFEVICVNDGSKDETLRRAIDAFDLVEAPMAVGGELPSARVRGIYRSLTHSEFVMVDKENGGRADALNAGINAARHPLICLIDADSLLEPNALTQAVLPFLESPDTAAVAGIIRVVNGCTVEAGRVVDVRVPSNWIARFQVVEYLRAFLAGRVAHSAMGALLIVSGAFGVFRRRDLVEVGGLDHRTIGEDMELVVRLHRRFRERGVPYKVVFLPDPVCWTEVPESRRILGSQRNRWQRGLLQVLTQHQAMIGRPRYGVIGLFAMPYYVLFEAAGPVIEVSGYLVTVVAVALGLLNVEYAWLMFLLSVVYGTLISLAAVALEEISYRRYRRVSDLLLLIGLGVIENFGYRQLTTWWRLKGTYDFLRGKSGWGAMTRKGFTVKPAGPPAAGAS